MSIAIENEFLELMRSGTVDIIFANEGELKALYQTSDLASAASAAKKDIGMAIVTAVKKVHWSYKVTRLLR